MISVGIGGAAGALLRYIISEFFKRPGIKKGRIFPLATWLINVSGSLLLGILYALSAEDHLSGQLWLLLGVGFCGGYTTFSTFGKEVIDLLLERYWKAACLYVVTSLILSLFAVWCGWQLMRYW